MFQPCKFAQRLQAACWEFLVVLTACLLFCGIVAAQDQSAAPSKPDLPLPATTTVPRGTVFPNFSRLRENNTVLPADSFSATSNFSGSSVFMNASIVPPVVRHITLDEAQQMAGGASNPLARLAALQVGAAKEHRLGVQSMYFPNIGGGSLRIFTSTRTQAPCLLWTASEWLCPWT
jgi:hypothetical protein